MQTGPKWCQWKIICNKLMVPFGKFDKYFLKHERNLNLSSMSPKPPATLFSLTIHYNLVNYKMHDYIMMNSSINCYCM